MDKKNIFLAAGGTGGHIFPAIAVAEQLKKKNYNPIFITDKRGRHMIGQGFKVISILSASPYNSQFIKRIGNILKLIIGTLQTIFFVLTKRPVAVIGFGGYPSVAPILVSHFMKKATMLHEQNAFFGRANHFVSPYVHKIALSWNDTRNIPEHEFKKIILTGMPVRSAFNEIARRHYTPPHNDGEIRILIVGGSLGAAVFDDVLPDAISRLPDNLRQRLRIVQQVRENKINIVKQKYDQAQVNAKLEHFIHHIDEYIAQAHLIIGRAGASIVAEIATAGIPALFVPYPHAMDDHQTANAETITKIGGGWLMPEKEMSAGSLAGRIASLINNPQNLVNASKSMQKLDLQDAAKTITDQIIILAKGSKTI